MNLAAYFTVGGNLVVADADDDGAPMAMIKFHNDLLLYPLATRLAVLCSALENLRDEGL